MIGRLRTLAERPLGLGTARIVALLGGAVCLGFVALVGLGLLGPGARDSARPVVKSPRASVPTVATSPRRPAGPGRPTRSATDRPEQDPQDRPGSPAARRAGHELGTHRALQHVPWHHGGVSIGLVGARGSKAVLEVRAASVAGARRVYRAFLRSFHDDGAAYLPRFRAKGGHRGR